MARKHKNVTKDGNIKEDSKTKEGSNSSSLFKTLFGEISEQDSTTYTLFSDNNPFRRKAVETRGSNNEANLGFVEKDAEPSRDSGISEFSDVNLEKKRKGDKLKKGSPTIDAESAEQKGKKFRSEKDKINESGFESKAALEEGNEQLTEAAGAGDLGLKSEKTKRKKRKRDEIEAEYEARVYGSTQDEEENKVEKANVIGEKRKKMDNPEDMMVSKEGFDDESRLLRTIFVGNLPLKLKKKEISKEFGKFGEIESIRIRSVPIVDGKIPRKGAVIKKRFNENVDSVNAYIVFKMEESAKSSLDHNMALVGGNHIRVDRACPPRKKLKADNSPLYDNKRTVFVGNLPFDVKDEEIYKLFTGIKNLESSVEAIRVVRDPGSSLGKGIAYVLFKTTDAAKLAAKKRGLKIRDRELRLSHAKSPETPLKRKSFSQPETDNPPLKKLSSASRTPDSSNTFKAKANPSSYQGLRASKSGVQKKIQTKSPLPRQQSNSKPKSKSRPVAETNAFGKNKRPAVAARKEKARLGAGASQLTGTKRKHGDQSPQAGRHNKKARKFK
ncbi:uncharacterized protein LOC127260708 isoform X2 [Andrographis paniculata]|uniref:uncharacterized protein LOC127260708 isoform X2 n=1 Tax=Andrographis paniculata TaxID=175694 RepID=UPI0021E896A6|nr:uncharacterized protein LOC127260708 isoform X2 [Andrographis paniculata]